MQIGRWCKVYFEYAPTCWGLGMDVNYTVASFLPPVGMNISLGPMHMSVSLGHRRDGRQA